MPPPRMRLSNVLRPCRKADLPARKPAGYLLCEQALRIDPNNVRALWVLAMKFHVPVAMGMSADPEADLKRADDLLSKALALEPTNASARNTKAWVLLEQGRFEEAIAERERTLALDPADVGAMAGMAWDQVALGQYEKGLELYDRAIRLSPRDPELQFMDGGKSWAYFGLKQYDQAIDWARRAIAVGTNEPYPHASLAAALALTGHEAEAREALQHCLALPSSVQFRTIAAFKAHNAPFRRREHRATRPRDLRPIIRRPAQGGGCRRSDVELRRRGLSTAAPHRGPLFAVERSSSRQDTRTSRPNAGRETSAPGGELVSRSQ